MVPNLAKIDTKCGMETTMLGTSHFVCYRIYRRNPLFELQDSEEIQKRHFVSGPHSHAYFQFQTLGTRMFHAFYAPVDPKNLKTLIISEAIL